MGMTRIGLAMIALAAARAANAQASGEKLWNDLLAGMTKAEVEAKYPKGGRADIALTGSCWGDISFGYVGGKLERVKMEWSAKDQGGDCGTVIGKTLLEKYGKPSGSEQERVDNDCGYGKGASLCRALGGDKDDYFTYTQWKTADGVDVTIKTEDGNSSKWFAVWKRSVGSDAAAASKL